jgi:ribosome-associated protein
LNDKDLALAIADIVQDKQGKCPEIIDVSSLVDYTDYILVCGGRSERHVRGIVEAIKTRLKAQHITPWGIEGVNHGQWVLMDYGGVIVHVFLEHRRAYYDIEGLWLDAKRLTMDGESLAMAAGE